MQYSITQNTLVSFWMIFNLNQLPISLLIVLKKQTLRFTLIIIIINILLFEMYNKYTSNIRIIQVFQSNEDSE